MSDINCAIESLKLHKTFSISDLAPLSDEDIDMAITALEKQIPYKPTSNVKFGIGKCKCGVEFLDKDTAYCGNCGQKLDWEEN